MGPTVAEAIVVPVVLVRHIQLLYYYSNDFNGWLKLVGPIL